MVTNGFPEQIIPGPAHDVGPLIGTYPAKMTLTDRVYAALPISSDQALSPRQLAEMLPGEGLSEISHACRQLRKWRLVAHRAGHGRMRRACNLWWKIA